MPLLLKIIAIFKKMFVMKIVGLLSNIVFKHSHCVVHKILNGEQNSHHLFSAVPSQVALSHSEATSVACNFLLTASEYYRIEIRNQAEQDQPYCSWLKFCFICANILAIGNETTNTKSRFN